MCLDENDENARNNNKPSNVILRVFPVFWFVTRIFFLFTLNRFMTFEHRYNTVAFIVCCVMPRHESLSI